MTAERLTIPPMPDARFTFMGFRDSNGSEVITTDCGELDTLTNWGKQGWEAAQAQARRAEHANRRAEYWKDEHNESNKVIDAARAEVEALKAQLAEARNNVDLPHEDGW